MKALLGNIFLFFVLCLSPLWGQEIEIDSLLGVLEKSLTDEERIGTYLDLSAAYGEQGALESGQAYLDSARGLSTEINSKRWLFECYVEQANRWSKQGRLSEAQAQFKQALDLESFATPIKVIEFYVGRGILQRDLGNYDVSLELAFQSLEKALALPDSSYLSRIYINIGGVYFEIEEYAKALDYFEKSLGLAQSLQDLSSEAIAWGNIAITKRKLLKAPEAFSAFARSIAINKSIGNTYQLSFDYNNLGGIYREMGNYDSAQYYYQQSLALSEDLKDELGVLFVNYNLAHLDFIQERWELARDKFEIVYQQAKEKQNKRILTRAAFTLAQIYYALDNYPKALEYAQLYENWRGVLVGEEKLKQINRLEAKYQNRQKQAEISKLSSRIQYFLATLDRQKLWITILGIGLISLSLIFTLIFFLYRSRLRNRQHKMTLKAITDAQEKERQRIAKDLHDSVGSMLAAIKHQLAVVDNEEQINHKVLGSLDKVSDEVRHIAHNMMPATLIREGLIAALHQLRNDISHQNFEVELLTFGLEKRMNPSMEILVYRIIQELVQNTLKHAEAHHLQIHLTRHRNTLNLIVEDDGQGMEEVPSAAKGLGLENIKERIENFKGEMLIDSQTGRGTSISIDIPLQKAKDLI